MYTPPSFRESRTEVLHDWIRQYPFASLVVGDVDGLQATHIPLLLSDDGTQLLGHVARANPVWKSFDGDHPVLAMFHGPHAYISPASYVSDFAVPTWNYVAVHAHGAAVVHDDPSRARDTLDRLVQASDRQGWRMDWADERADGLLQAIVAFGIHITLLEGKAKLGQNRPADDQQSMAQALTASSDPHERDLAAFTAHYLPTTTS